ncbi:DUF397 domain-containing protein [Actinosynnema pretiosum subsp. pretiosum]|uniref:DUF397 domain-containing protein n=1 Tax=Actinosynnema pretiosum subsp. pretiosum TaxID=103721 RepID=A0AA45L4V3_9PSEU|nr:protein of unknown function DUF397 [Actinosynnema pretiosum subsp. pretiosum]QUF03311.1 DUF397 domain-containing protein [Actinosynnema pretiosum subsp. pretiosum]
MTDLGGGGAGSCARWRKSSRSTNVANCVELALGGAVAAVRDSKNPAGAVLLFPRPRWAAFLAGWR